MSRQQQDALDVLRTVWSAEGTSSADLDEAYGHKKSCKNMVNVGFDGMAGPDGDLPAAWRAKLAREGKLSTGAGSIRDLVLGAEATRDQATGD